MEEHKANELWTTAHWGSLDSRAVLLRNDRVNRTITPATCCHTQCGPYPFELRAAREGGLPGIGR